MLAAGAAMVVGTLVPLAFGTLFMLAGKAVMTSVLAITISAIMGLKTMFGKSESVQAVKSLSAPALRPSHYDSEAIFEQESTAYRNKGETEAHDSDPDVFIGESVNDVHRGYYNRPEPQQLPQSAGGSSRPQWAGAGAAKSVNNDDKFNKTTGAKNGGYF